MTRLRRYLAAEIGDEAAARACDIVSNWLIHPEATAAVSLGIAGIRTGPLGDGASSTMLACAGLAVLSTAVVAEYTEEGDDQ